MRYFHQSGALQPLATVPRQLHLHGALQLQARSAGWLRVQHGRVWLTRSGETTDHVLATGDSLHLGAGDSLLVEPWRGGDVAGLDRRAGRHGAASRLGRCA